MMALQRMIAPETGIAAEVEGERRDGDGVLDHRLPG